MSPTTTNRTGNSQSEVASRARFVSALCARLQDRQRIDGGVVDPYLEVQMRACRVPRAPDQGDDRASLDVRTFAHEQFGGVCVGVAGVACLDDDQLAVTALPAGVDHGARAGGDAGVAGVAVDVEP